MNIYKEAVLRQIRFETTKGTLSLEQVSLLPLKTQRVNMLDLNTLAAHCDNACKTANRDYTADTVETSSDNDATLRFDLILDLIKTRKEENKAKLVTSDEAARRIYIKQALIQRKNKDLADKTQEELMEMLKG